MSSAVDLVLSKSIQIALAWSKVNANSSTSILICLYKSYLVSNTAPHDYATAGVFDVSLINIWLLRGHHQESGDLAQIKGAQEPLSPP